MKDLGAASDLPILMTGLNHKTAPVEVRERLAFGPERIVPALKQLAGGGSCAEVVLLSTCNRMEIYVSSSDLSAAAAEVESFMSAHAGVPVGELRQFTHSARGQEAATHLFRVAAGLDSLVLGENEILGQVRSASEAARAAGTCGPVLSALFRYATQAGKRVRTETAIGSQQISVATVVVELAEQCLGRLNNRTALLIGAGKISALTARALTQAGLHCIMIANRTYERARKLAETLGGVVVRFDALQQTLIGADIVICSTGAPHTVLHAEAVAAAQRARQGQPLLIADLAVPRDVDQDVASIPGICLVNVDDLQALVKSRHPLAASVCQQAEALVQLELESFSDWYRARRFAPAIAALHRRAEEICQAEVEQTLRRLGPLTPRQEQLVQAMGRAITGRLLHEPTMILRRLQPGQEAASNVEAARNRHGAP